MTKKVHYQTIVSAKAGDVEAMAKILDHFSAYIAVCSVRPFFDQHGNRYDYVDEEIVQQIKSKLMIQIIYKFNPFQLP